MQFDEILMVAVRGVGIGSIFSLLAMSMNVTYNASHIINFAQGNMFVLGGFIAVGVAEMLTGVPVWMLMIPLAGLALGAVMLVQGWITLLPLRKSVEQHSWLITTMAVSIIISAAILILQGPWAADVASVLPPTHFLGMETPAPYFAVPALMLFWYFGLNFFYRRTIAGLAMSALSQDIDAARTAGLQVRRLQLLSFVVSGIIVGTAGFVAAPIITIGSESGIRYVLNGFLAAVVGGFGNNLGALIGGPLVGVITMIATYKIGGQYQAFVSLVLLVAVLMLRPEGLFGRPAARRV
jgi:branched-chain amino acid transport system permease protein